MSHRNALPRCFPISHRSTLLWSFLALVAMISACPDCQPAIEYDAAIADAGRSDSALPDSRRNDTTVSDTTAADANVADSHVTDSHVADTAVVDSHVPDATQPDTSVTDAAVADSTFDDSSVADSAVADHTVVDTGIADSTAEDSAVEDAAPLDANPIGSVGNPGLSCADILARRTAASDGRYWIQPSTIGASFEVLCDMTQHGGGWTLVVGIGGGDRNHVNPDAVTPENLVDVAGKGKLADSAINALKGGSDPAYRFSCRSLTGFFPAACAFDTVTDAAGACTAEAYGYPPASYGTAQFVQAEHKGLADGSSGATNRLIYGRVGSPGNLTGCDEPGGGWNGDGTVWVR